MSDMLNRPPNNRGSTAGSPRTLNARAGALFYRVVWWGSAVVVGAAGILACLSFVPLGLATMAAVLAGGLGCGVAGLLPGTQPAALRKTRLLGLGFGILMGLTVAGLAGMAGGGAAALPLLMLATSPAARGVWARVGSRIPLAPTPGVRADVHNDSAASRTRPTRPERINVRGMTDAQLCWAWRASFTDLQRCAGGKDVAALAAARASYLDELELRDPAGFARWLTDGARAASDPGRYLHTNGRDPDPASTSGQPTACPESGETPEADAGQ